MEDRTAKYNLIVQIGILLTTVANVVLLICALYVAINALTESSRMNKMSYTGQLYANEQKWIERCAAMPHGFSLFAIPSEKADTKSYIKQLLSLVPHNKRTEFSSVADFYTYIWAVDGFNARGKKELRQLYDIAENILYHIHTAFDYCEGGLISKNEYESWAALINDVGPHPLLLASIYNGHERKYISQKFARELQIRILSDARGTIAEQFYPAIKDSKWADSLYDY